MRYFGGQPVDMGNAGAIQAQSPLYNTPLAPVWGGGPLVPGSVPGREGFLGPAPTEKYKMSADPSFQIGPRSPFKGMSQEELNKLKEWDSRPGDLQKYYEQQNQTGPRLPFAGSPGAVGNMGGLVAQAQNVGAMAGAGALGGGMGMNSEQMQRQMQELQQQGGGPPIRFGVDIENEKVKNLRGSVNANLDANQSVRFGGNYNVQDQSGQLGVGYQTPTFGFDVNMIRTPGMPNVGPGYGVQGNVMGRF